MFQTTDDEVTNNIAVIGSGISGLSCAYLLQRGGHNVTLYERDENCGGHTLTDHSSPYPVDLGFQVYNLTTYPNFVGFLEELGIDSEPSDMSFSLSINDGELEWSGDNLDTVFAQRKNLVSPTFLRMVWEVTRFGREAPLVLKAENEDKYSNCSLGEYLEMKGYSTAFRRHYILPMCAAVWSAPEATMTQFPLIAMIRFWVNHHLLDIFQRPVWRVVKGRSESYVKKVISMLPVVHTSTQVLSVEPLQAGQQGVRVQTNKQECDGIFDSVVLATHSDVSLNILGSHATQEQKHILKSIPYECNDVYLHTDAAWMPKLRKTWASWNCLSSSSPESDKQQVCVTYWANRLQTFPEDAPDLFVTLNPPKPPQESTIIRRLKLDHPVFGAESMKAQQQLDEVQGVNNIFFTGAWCGYGFHEDGLKSAIKVAKKFGVVVPWTPRSCSPKTTFMQSFYQNVFFGFAKAALVQGSMRFVLPDGTERRFGNGVNNKQVDRSEWRGAPETKTKVRVMDVDMFEKMIRGHDIGLGEAYIAGDFEVDDIGAFVAVLVANAELFAQYRSKLGILNWAISKFFYLVHVARSNTREGSRKNISSHYDAGNTMYGLFLDETMTYSSGIHGPGMSLKDAQLKKIDALIELAGISSNDHVLEIGCGWGSFAIRAVQATGCKVTGVTISREQLQEAQLRVRSHELQNKINLMFCDYRDIPMMGCYDKVVSIEMIEAVGQEHLSSYFKVVSNALRPGGCAVIQAITGTDERYAEYCRSSDFIREYIFPGGHLPCISAIVDIISTTELSLTQAIDIGPHYAITLREWRKQWEERKQAILQIGYSNDFWRKYQFYFAYCEAAFDAGYIQDYHLLFTKSDIPTPIPRPPHSSPPQNPQMDTITQLLLCLYFFLIGTVITQHGYMWVMPLTGMLYTISGWIGSQVGGGEDKEWKVNCVLKGVFAGSAFCGALLNLYLYPEVLDLTVTNRNEVFGTVLNCYAAGFYSSQLWAYVQYRLYQRYPLELLHFVVMLFFFASGAYKYENSAFLSTIMLSQLTQVIAFLKVEFNNLKYVEVLSHIVAGICLNALQTVMVFHHPEVFSGYGYFLSAFVGMMYMNCYNVVRLVFYFF